MADLHMAKVVFDVGADTNLFVARCALKEISDQLICLELLDMLIP